MRTIAIITAMECEYNAIYSLYNFKELAGYSKAEVDDKTIYLIKSGIGKVNGALAAQKASDLSVDIIINTGLAGGVDSSLKQGDIVLANFVCYHDVWCGSPNQIGQVQDFPLYYELEQDLLKKINTNTPKDYFKIGLTVTGDQFLTDVNRLKEIKSTFPNAYAVDMESAAIAQTCYINNKKFISLRIISDVVGKSGQEEQYKSFWQNIPAKASEMVDIVIKSL